MPSQTVIIDTDAVQINRAVTGPDRNIHRCYLGKVIIGWILNNPGRDAIDIRKQEPVFCGLLCHKRHPDMLILLILSGNLGLLGF